MVARHGESAIRNGAKANDCQVPVEVGTPACSKRTPTHLVGGFNALNMFITIYLTNMG